MGNRFIYNLWEQNLPKRVSEKETLIKAILYYLSLGRVALGRDRIKGLEWASRLAWSSLWQFFMSMPLGLTPQLPASFWASCCYCLPRPCHGPRTTVISLIISKDVPWTGHVSEGERVFHNTGWGGNSWIVTALTTGSYWPFSADSQPGTYWDPSLAPQAEQEGVSYIAECQSQPRSFNPFQRAPCCPDIWHQSKLKLQCRAHCLIWHPGVSSFVLHNA